MNTQDDKTCFVISPIGEPGSDVRRRSDQVFKFIIEPIARECGYSKIVRADVLNKPGIITSQIVKMLIDADLVIADLKGHNPNVFYELAIRHMTKKPVVQIYGLGERLPFDIVTLRGIPLDHTDLDSIHSCKETLRTQIAAAESDKTVADNPISIAVDLNAIRGSGNPSDQVLLQVQATFQTILERLDDLRPPAEKLRVSDPELATDDDRAWMPSMYGIEPGPLAWLNAIMAIKGQS